MTSRAAPSVGKEALDARATAVPAHSDRAEELGSIAEPVHVAVRAAGARDEGGDHLPGDQRWFGLRDGLLPVSTNPFG